MDRPGSDSHKYPDVLSISWSHKELREVQLRDADLQHLPAWPGLQPDIGVGAPANPSSTVNNVEDTGAIVGTVQLKQSLLARERLVVMLLHPCRKQVVSLCCGRVLMSFCVF